VIVVDTSVWVAALRGDRARIGVALSALLDADEVALALPVRAELLAGVKKQQRAALKRALTGVPVLVPSEATWPVVEGWIERGADAGERFSVTDLMIAALARDIGALVWSVDKDFARMEALKIVDLYSAA
jgi:predicted nucleic acid-binding protein